MPLTAGGSGSAEAVRGSLVWGCGQRPQGVMPALVLSIPVLVTHRDKAGSLPWMWVLSLCGDTQQCPHSTCGNGIGGWQGWGLAALLRVLGLLGGWHWPGCSLESLEQGSWQGGSPQICARAPPLHGFPGIIH